MRISRRARRGLIAAPFVLGAVIAVVVIAPGVVRDRVSSEAKARTGLEVRIGSSHIGWSSVTLEGLALGDEHAGPSIAAARVTVGANLFGLAFGGRSAIDAVEVEGLRVVLPMDDPRTTALFDRLRSRAKPRSGVHSPSKGGGPSVAVGAFDVLVSDSHGQLIAVSGQSASMDKAGLRALLREIALGASGSTEVTVRDLAAHAVRGENGIRLRELAVGSIAVALPTEVDDAPEPAFGEEGQDATTGAPAQTATAPSAPIGLMARLKALLRRPAGEALPVNPAAADKAGPQAVDASAADSAPAWGRLAEDVVITLKSAGIRNADKRPVAEKLAAELRGKGGGVFALTARGQAAGGGSTRCELALRPAKLQADGTLELRAMPLTLLAPLLPAVPWHDADQATVDASLVIKTESVQRVALSGEASVHGAAIAAARIAPTPVRGIDFTLSGRGYWLPLEKRLELEQGTFRLGEAETVVHGAVEWSPDHYLLDLDATMRPTPCTDAVRSIPEDLLGDMAVATWQGKIGGHVRLKVDSRDLPSTELDFDIDDHCDFVAVPAMADLRRFRMPFIHSVVEPDGQTFEMETGPGTPAWTYLEDVSPFFVHAVLAHEDASFFTHRGFSPLHIRNALVRNLTEGRYVVGASTITMQLVKNIFLHREKTLARKIQEVLLTWWIERVMDKSEILELYLNVIEYGPGVYGIRNGARHYFNRLPSQLSPAESVYLATILPNPKRYHSAFERGSLSPGWAERVRKMLERMRARGWYSPEAADYGLQELEHFRFVPEGQLTEPREIPGSTALLPYMRNYGSEGGWEMMDAPAGGGDGFDQLPLPPG